MIDGNILFGDSSDPEPIMIPDAGPADPPVDASSLARRRREAERRRRAAASLRVDDPGATDKGTGLSIGGR